MDCQSNYAENSSGLPELKKKLTSLHSVQKGRRQNVEGKTSFEILKIIQRFVQMANLHWKKNQEEKYASLIFL